MLRSHGDHDRRVLGALTLVYGGGIGERNLVQFPEFVLYRTPVKIHINHSLFYIDTGHPANIAVEDLFVVVVNSLDHLIAGGEDPAEAAETRLSRGIEASLELAV